MDNWKKIVKGFLIVSLSIILIFCGLYSLHIRRENKFMKGPICTTKTIWIKHSFDADANKVIVYKIEVMNRVYKGHFWLNNVNETLIKDTMLVKFLCRDPNINELVIEPLKTDPGSGAETYATHFLKVF